MAEATRSGGAAGPRSPKDLDPGEGTSRGSPPVLRKHASKSGRKDPHVTEGRTTRASKKRARDTISPSPSRSRSPRRLPTLDEDQQEYLASPQSSRGRHSSISPPLSPASPAKTRGDPFGRRVSSSFKRRLAPQSPELGTTSQPPVLTPILPELPESFQEVLARAIAQGIASGMSQQPQGTNREPTQGIPRKRSAQHRPSASREGRSPSPSTASEGSDLEEGELKDIGLSDDEETQAPEAPNITGLFPPALFSSLLRKARATADLESNPEPAQAATNPGTSGKTKKGPFHRPRVEKEEIPTPDFFLEVLKSQWTKPGTFPSPGSNERRFYNLNSNFAQALQVPPVDTPVAHLASASAVVAGDISNCLKAEDRKAEIVMRRTFQAVSWAIKAAAAASFFNRSTLLWLEQLRDRTPASEVRLLQDITKILAATQFSADATLDVVKYSSRALSSSVTSRRLLWLRHWQAESRAKWHLAGAEYTGDQLFGSSLDPILVEDRSKRKVFPATNRRSDHRLAPYPRRTPFRPPETEFQHSRYPAPRFPRQGDRPFTRDRSRSQPQGKRPFRGGGGRPFRRFK